MTGQIRVLFQVPRPKSPTPTIHTHDDKIVRLVQAAVHSASCFGPIADDVTCWTTQYQ